MLTNKPQKIIQLLNKAHYELKMYLQNQRFPHLSQACEKTWVAYILLLEYKSGKEIKKGGKIIIDTAQDLGLYQLYKDARYLHVIHYEGSPAITDEEMEISITETINLIRREING